MEVDLSLKELYLGEETVIGESSFKSTKDYVEPFVDVASKYTENFVIRAVEQKQKVGKDSNVTYNRVWVQGVLPEEQDGHKKVISMVYGLDIRKPVFKFYKGFINSACTNLTVFNPSWINIQEIENSQINYEVIDSLFNKDDKELFDKLKVMKNTTFDRDGQIKMLGTWVDNSLKLKGMPAATSNMSSIPIKAYTSLFLNSSSEYYIPEGVNPNQFDIYNAFTQVLTDDKKDISNKFEKTMLVNKILAI